MRDQREMAYWFASPLDDSIQGVLRMPTYTVTAPDGRLSSQQRQRIAAEITRIHHEITGAPTYFAQVIFVDVKPGNYFVGGIALASDQLFVHGQIRAGRSAENKQRLIVQILDAAADAAAMPKSHVWVYITELPAAQMAEFGHVLPEPGEETAWTAALPAAERERMQSIGRQAT
jgi:phenylpyruvate tautomerase PptA (4-oxalocrotonate tautomerase family)